MADSISASPQNPALGAIARFLHSVKQGGQAESWVPLIGGVNLGELLLGKAPEEIENWSYGNAPTRINPNTGVPGLKPGRGAPLADALFLAADVAPAVSSATRAVARGTEAAVIPLLRAQTGNATLRAQDVYRAMGEGSAPLTAIVKPQGNINLVPITRAEMLKGPDVQPVENFLAQVRSTPGVTAEGFDELAKRYQGLEPGTRMSKTEFEQLVPASQFNKEDITSAGVNMEHLRDEAENYLEVEDVFNRVVERLGGSNASDKTIRELHEFYYGNIDETQISPKLKQLLERNKIQDARELEDVVGEARVEALEDIAQGLRERFADDSGGFFDVQRLVNQPELSSEGYFELGVTHPELRGQHYRHYGDYENVEEGIAGHARGTYFKRGDSDDARALMIGKNKSGMPFTFTAKPNSLVIEEIQSDLQKGQKQTGPLRQVHGTVFKAAVDEALQRGARTVYLPTADAIGLVRGTTGAPYAAIYDQQIVKEGLKPLLKIPGVTVTDIPGDGSLAGKIAYRQIDFTDEAREYLLNGPGQAAPGWAKGGLVKMSHGGVVHFDKGGAVEYDPEVIDALATTLMSDTFELEPDERFTAALARRQVKPEDLQLREGAFSVRPVRGGDGYSARLAADLAPGTQAFADVNPFRRLVEQYGLQYSRPMPNGAAAAELRYDPITQAKTLSGVFRQMLDKDSEISARGSYVHAGERPNYGVNLEYRRRFATGGAVSANDYDEGKIQALADALLEELHG